MKTAIKKIYIMKKGIKIPQDATYKSQFQRAQVQVDFGTYDIQTAQCMYKKRIQ